MISSIFSEYLSKNTMSAPYPLIASILSWGASLGIIILVLSPRIFPDKATP
jgi:hypothetical protein